MYPSSGFTKDRGVLIAEFQFIAPFEAELEDLMTADEYREYVEESEED